MGMRHKHAPKSRGALGLSLLFACLKGAAAFALTLLALAAVLCQTGLSVPLEAVILVPTGCCGLVLGVSVARLFRTERFFAAAIAAFVLDLLLLLLRLGAGNPFTGWTAAKLLVLLFFALFGASFVRVDPWKRRRVAART